MKAVYILIIVSFTLAFNHYDCKAQTPACLEFLKSIKDKNPREVIKTVEENKAKFDFTNAVDELFYEWILGVKYYQCNDYANARPHLKRTTEICDANSKDVYNPSWESYLVSYYWLSVCDAFCSGDTNLAIQELQKARKVFEDGQLTNSVFYRQILSDSESLKNGSFDAFKGVQSVMNDMFAGAYEHAIPQLENIIAKWPSSASPSGRYLFIQALGTCYVNTGNLNAAENMYLNALAEMKRDKMENGPVYRRMCNALGGVYAELHNYQKTLDYCGEAKSLYEKYLDFGLDYIQCLSNCALAEDGLQRPLMAKELIDVALSHLRKIDADSVKTSMLSLYEQLSKYTNEKVDVKNASSLLNRAYNIVPLITILSNASTIYFNSGFVDDAIKAMKECVALMEANNEPYSLAYNNLACLYLSQNKVKEALPYFQKSMANSKTLYESTEIGFNYALALWLDKSPKSNDIAISTAALLKKNIQDCFAFLSEEERMKFYETFDYYLPFLNFILWDNKDQSEYGTIYDNILLSKGLLLKTTNRIKEAIMTSGNEQAVSTYNRMIELRQKLANTTDVNIQSELNKEIEELDKKLTRTVSFYGSFTHSSQIRWKDVQSHLGASDVAIEFYNIPLINRKDSIQKTDGQPRYCAVVLRKGYESPHIVPLCTEAELDSVDSEDYYTTDYIYTKIWKPLAGELQGVKNIYFSADRRLYNIAIEYVKGPDDKTINDLYNIYRLTSTSEIAESHTPTTFKKVVLYGGLKYDLTTGELLSQTEKYSTKGYIATRSFNLKNLRYGVHYLPGTFTEIEKIDTILSDKGISCKKYSGAEGTEESFRALSGKDINILHLATHGFFWSDDDIKSRNYVSFLQRGLSRSQNKEDLALLRSGLFFSGANISLKGESLPNNIEDGVLTAGEVSTLSLGNVDLVVMSACESGLGESDFDGVFGLQRGFKLAGAKSLLMSLWKVDDTATKMLMVEFYRNLISGCSKVDALRKAQHYVKQKAGYEDPEYWAGFILLDAFN